MLQKKIFIVSGFCESLINFRGDLIKSLVNNGWSVTAFSSDTHAESIKLLKEMGVGFKQYHIDRASFNFLKDIRGLFTLISKIKKDKPDLMLAYSIKPILYSCIISRVFRIRMIPMFTGLGSLFLVSPGDGFIKTNIRKLYLNIIRKADKYIFQNKDDLELLLSFKAFHRNRCLTVSGSGVNLNRFSVMEKSAPFFSFLFMGRLLREKGVHHYIEVAKRMYEKYPEVKFSILGDYDKNPSSIQPEDMRKALDRSNIEYLGYQSNVSHIISECDCFVLPSFYREGIPRSILESMAVGRPIITTDSVGCRETIRTSEKPTTETPFLIGENGYLILSDNSEALYRACIHLIEHKEKTKSMGEASRKYAEDRFDVYKVNEQLIAAIDEVYAS